MVHILRSLVSRAYHYFLVVVQIRHRYLLYLPAHRCREQQRIALCGYTLQYLVDTLRESHVQHLVSLVEHHVYHAVELCHAAVHQVDESSRCCHYYLRSVPQLVHLVHYRRTPIHCHDVHTLHILRIVAQVVGYLQTQFTCRANHYRLCRPAAHVDLLQQRYPERRCLAGTCLCQCNYIVAYPQQIRNNLLLYGHRVHEPHLLYRPAYLRRDA